MQRFVMMCLAGFVFVFVFDYLIHGIILKAEYKDTSIFWRNPSDMKIYFPMAAMLQLMSVFVLGYIFTRNFEEKGVREGVRFGLTLGLLVGICSFSMYAYMPITLTLALSWLTSSILEVIGLGVIFALLYKNP